MPDPRVTKLAQVIVRYSLDLQPGELFTLATSPLAEELSLEVYKEAVKAGAHITIQNSLPGAEEAFYVYASDEQLVHVSPVRKLIWDTFDALLYIQANHNTRSLSGIDPAKIVQVRQAYAELNQQFYERAARKEAKWLVTVYPTHAMAQEANMSLADYADFVYKAGMLHLDDPVAFWKAEGVRQREIIDWLEEHDQITLKGENVDLSFSIKGRTFEPCDGKYNFPDGEVFTGPVEDSAQG
jgi:aminopeptidase